MSQIPYSAFGGFEHGFCLDVYKRQVCGLAIMLKQPITLLIVGFVYVMETLSVIMQVTSYKLTGKRIFKMSPIHHHFEMCGWSEVTIVCVFSAVTVLLCALMYYFG